MQWIALQWPPEDGCAAPQQAAGRSHADSSGRLQATHLCAGPRAGRDIGCEAGAGGAFDPLLCAYWALQFTPRVVWMGEVLLLEVSASLRLWGGLRALLSRMDAQNPAAASMQKAQSDIGLIAIAQLRLRVAGLAVPSPALCPAALPLHTLDAARPHLPVLERLGCRTWGQAQALPRGGLVRRFGSALRAALDVAFGLAPESYPWLTLPEHFDQALELHARIDSAPALLWAATRLLGSLQHWLRARQLGVLAFELSWTLDLKRLNGQPLPPGQALPIRTAQPTQAMEHLRRLLAERLAQVRLAAPAVHLRLRATDTAPWHAGSHSLVPEDRRQGDPLHVFIERVSARLGADRVLVAEPVADHRPERRQRWRPALQALAGSASQVSAWPTGTPEPPVANARPAPKTARAVHPGWPVHPMPPDWPDALAPTSLLLEPLALATRQGEPCHHGPLRLLTAARRIEAGWWPEATAHGDAVAGPTGETDCPAAIPCAPPSQGQAEARSTPSTRAAGEAAQRGGRHAGAGPLPSGHAAPLGGSAAGEAAQRGGRHAGARPLSSRRDYFIAQNPRGELLWVFCERPTAARPGQAVRWFLHGIYA